MRGSHNLRLTDVHKIQKNIKEKTQREADALIQLMELPDFDTSQFIQTLLKSENYEQVMQRLPMQKKIDFFAKNYQDFLNIQEELLSLQIPTLQVIPQAKQFTFENSTEIVQNDNMEQSSVLQIIDSFSSFVFEKNTDQALRIYKIIQDMKKHSKYKIYFNSYHINKIFSETYNSFVDNCQNHQILLKLNQYQRAIKVYLIQKKKQILSQIKVNLNLNDSAISIGKEMSRLVIFIQAQVKNLKIKFKKQLEKSEDLTAIICEWIQILTKDYYQLIQTYIYQKEQLSQILQSLSILLDASTQLQSKGVTLERHLKQLIVIDLPLHISKVIQIIVQSVNQILKESNQLYEFKYFTSIKKFSTDLNNLKLITRQQFGKKCATCKGIILVNSFVLILENVCDEKWSFLHEGIIDILINKIALNILNSSLHYWDYYFIYQFFQRLSVGKIKHKQLISGEASAGILEKLQKIKNLAKESWNLFESKIYNQFFKEILSNIPNLLYNFKKYAYDLEKQDLRPSTFSISLIFKFQDFLKQIQFRISTSQFEFITQVLYQFILYSIQYILLWSYHNKGTNDKVFILYNKQAELLKKAKQFNFLEIQEVKQNKLINLSKINKFGFYKLAFEIYFLAEAIKIMSDVKKIDAQQFNSRLSKILAKDQKKDALDVSKTHFQQVLAKMIKVYKQKPEVMHNYLNDRMKV